MPTAPGEEREEISVRSVIDFAWAVVTAHCKKFWSGSDSVVADDATNKQQALDMAENAREAALAEGEAAKAAGAPGGGPYPPEQIKKAVDAFRQAWIEMWDFLDGVAQEILELIRDIIDSQDRRKAVDLLHPACPVFQGHQAKWKEGFQQRAEAVDAARREVALFAPAFSEPLCPQIHRAWRTAGAAIEAAAPKGWIEFQSGRVRKRTQLREKETVVGSGPECSVHIGSKNLARRHFRILAQSGEWWIEDLGGCDGTFVDGNGIAARSKLADGAHIAAGSAEFTFVLGSEGGTIGTDEDIDSFLTGMDEEWFASDSVIDRRLPIEAAFEPGASAGTGETSGKLGLLYETAQLLVRSGNIDELLTSLSGRLYEDTEADYIAILLSDVESGRTRCFGQWIHGNQIAESALMLSKNVVREAVKSRAGVLSTSAGDDERFAGAESIQNMQINSVVCCPMVCGGRVWGVLYLDTRMGETFMGQEELRLVTCLANLAAVFLEGLRLRSEVVATTRKRALLERYFSPGLTEKLLAGGGELGAGGRAVEGTILCADVRAFTSFAERATPNEVVEFLNEFYGTATETLFEHGGVVDKYAGDAVLGVFGSPFKDLKHAAHAIECANALLGKLRGVNARRTATGLGTIAVGIGIASGQFVHGVVGHDRKLEYTVIGHTVNVAFRLAGLAKAGEVLISDATRAAVREKTVSPMGSVVLKGRAAATQIFRLPDIDS